VRLGREVDDHVDRVLAQRFLDARQVGDVAVHERDRVAEVREVRTIAGIGEGVEDDDPVVGMRGVPVVNEVRPDESRTAGDEQVHVRNGNTGRIRSGISERLGFA
jgi:hypothetical protein